jgi:hypothetical protein
VPAEFGGNGLVDLDEELPELAGAMVRVQGADRLAVAVSRPPTTLWCRGPDVVVTATLRHARNHRQYGLGPVEGLDLPHSTSAFFGGSR